MLAVQVSRAPPQRARIGTDPYYAITPAALRSHRDMAPDGAANNALTPR